MRAPSQLTLGLSSSKRACGVTGHNSHVNLVPDSNTKKGRNQHAEAELLLVQTVDCVQKGMLPRFVHSHSAHSGLNTEQKKATMDCVGGLGQRGLRDCAQTSVRLLASGSNWRGTILSWINLYEPTGRDWPDGSPGGIERDWRRQMMAIPLGRGHCDELSRLQPGSHELWCVLPLRGCALDLGLFGKGHLHEVQTF